MSEYNPSKNNLLLDSSWYKGTVIKGARTGRTIGYPTANINDKEQMANDKRRKGVYHCLVKIEDKIYNGMLYFGPRLVKNETHDVVEINVLDFGKEIYNQVIKFKLKEYIRGVMDFKSIDELKEQLASDSREIRLLI